ncbi:MAG: DUF6777 domain-containing protein [Actinomycetota bacterium]
MNEQESAGSGTTRIVVAIGAVLALIAAGFGAFTLLADDAEAVSQIFAEPVSSVGIDPFTPDLVAPAPMLNPEIGTRPEFVEADRLPPLEVGVDASIAFGSSVPDDAAEVGVTLTGGGAVGLYGGTELVGVCDKQRLVDFLATNPDKAQAWADIHGISRGMIAAYVDGLTVAILAQDTLVTNHGFRDGAANPIQSVLQAGNAVLVDERGVPRVRCKCGNPLLEPELGALARADEITIVGDRWSGLSLSDAVAITPSSTVIETFEQTDIESGATVLVDAGSEVASQVSSVPTFATPTVVEATGSSDPATPTPIPEPDLTATPDSSSGSPPPSPTALPSTPTPVPPTPTPIPPTPVPPTPTPVPTSTPLPTSTPTPVPRTLVTLTNQGTVTANSTFAGFPASLAVDGNVSSSWFSTGPSAGPGVFTWTGPRSELTEVSILGNSAHANPNFRSGFGFASVTMQVFDGGTEVFSASGSGLGWQFQPNVEGDRIVLTFIGHEDVTCGGFAELIVKGLV